MPSLFQLMTQCPSLSQPYCQYRATKPHVSGRRRDTGPTGQTVLRRYCLEEACPCRTSLSKNTVVICLMSYRDPLIKLCSSHNTLHSIVGIDVLLK